MAEPPSASLDDHKRLAQAWFETLRGRLCAALEALGDSAPAGLLPGRAGPFRAQGLEPRGRRRRRDVDDAGPRVPKVGVHVSTVHSAFSRSSPRTVPGAGADHAVLRRGGQP